MLFYILNSPNINTATNTSIATASITILNSILLYFLFYYNLSSKYIT